ncbi:transposase [Geobacillus stearothermophilus]|uniref:IS4-like element IS5377 family transposase n=3 Tax=Geobacillus stearothermophilus TaxID=1422 RepID=UPI0006A2364F|nr:IS4-like element IS5377 family transposase [Geobacillus stearothermophilus]KMY57632.1 transposase [Geobacillus stearothermophilus]
MNKHTTLPNLMQKLVSDEEIQLIAEAVGYRDSSRTFTLRELIHFFLLAAMHQWKSFRHGADVGPLYGLPRFHYSTVSKKAKEVPYDIMKRLLALIISKCNRQTRRSLRFPKPLRVVDSTTVTVGKNRLPWAPYHGERAGVKLHVAYSPESSLPADVVETTGLRHDGPVGEQLTNAQQVLVEDRAYFKIERLDRFVEQHQLFVIRMKDNIELHQKKSLKRLSSTSSSVQADFTCQLGTKQCRSTKRHRVVIFRDANGRDIRVVTNLFHASAETIADMYQQRWTVEVFFRWVKQYLNVPTLFGTTENAVYNQLFGAFIAYVLLRWLYDQTKKQTNVSLSFISFVRRFFSGQLPLDWKSGMAAALFEYAQIYGRRMSNFG